MRGSAGRTAFLYRWRRIAAVAGIVAAGALFFFASRAREVWRLEGSFGIAHSAPIFQDITRAALLTHSPGGKWSIHFSTLESFHRRGAENKFLWVSYAPASDDRRRMIIEGAIEARAYAYARPLGQYVLGTSGDPQLLLYDPVSGGLTPIF